MNISEATRRDILDSLRVEGVSWNGRLEEPDFLKRIFDVDKMPSTDGRFRSAYGDIWQHRINNEDWDDDWIFHDSRFNLLGCDDELFLRFLCEIIHPVVRADPSEVNKLCQMFNQSLSKEGYELVERTRMASRPVFAARRLSLSGAKGLPSVRQAKTIVDFAYVLQQITRMEAAIEEDPGLAIGTAKELIETVCKTILAARGVSVPRNPEVPYLMKETTKALKLTPDDIPDKVRASDTIRKLLSNLSTVAQGLAELRNQFGTGHGRQAHAKTLSPRHAKLAVGAASTLAVFLMETHQYRQ